MDTREAILSRLVEIAETVDGVRTVLRNQQTIDQNAVPAIIILDADEMANPREVKAGREMISPPLVDLRPEIFIVLGELPENVGSDLNSYRAALVKAIMTDVTLFGLCGSHGDRIKYDGAVTALAAGRQMVGEMLVNMTFTYFMRFDQL